MATPWSASIFSPARPVLKLLVFTHGDGPAARIKIRIAAPPVDGEANQELLRFLKKQTGIPAARIRFLRGESSRSKDVLFSGVGFKALLSLMT